MKRITLALIFISAGIHSLFSQDSRLQKVKEDLLIGTKMEKIKAIEYCGISREKSCFYILIKAMEDPDSDIRKEAAGSLGMLQVEESIPFFEKLLKKEEDSAVKKAIIQAIGYAGFESGAPLLLPFLSDNASDLRLVTARALSKLRAKSTLDQINGALEGEKDDLIRVTLIYASLAINVNNPNLIYLLADYYFHESVAVRYQAALASQDLKIKELLEKLQAAYEIEELPWLQHEFKRAYSLTVND